ncbi:MAG: glycosyltransferase 87 family protein, partial [Vicinamibacteria bacterium]
MTGSGLLAWRVGALLLALVQLPVLLRTGADPSQSDFANYFTPAVVLAHRGEVGALYDRDAFDLALRRTGIVGLGSFVPHPPANALWLLPFAAQPAAVAKALWSGVLLGAIAVTILAVARLRAGLSPAMATVLVLAPTLAIRNGLAFGQPYLILGALLALGCLALERGREFLAGFLLGLGVSFKPYSLLIGTLFHGDALNPRSPA